MSRWIRWGAVATGIGAVGVLGGIVAEMHDRWVGVTVVMVSATLAVCGLGAVFVGVTLCHHARAVRPVEDAYDEGRDLGYSKGWRDCARQNVRPVTKLDPRRASPESAEPAHVAKSPDGHSAES